MVCRDFVTSYVTLEFKTVFTVTATYFVAGRNKHRREHKTAMKFFSIVKPTRCTFCIQIMNSQPLHVSSTTCSSLGGAAQTTIGILRACCVCWLLPGLE
jgi:hypothetical protein